MRIIFLYAFVLFVLALCEVSNWIPKKIQRYIEISVVLSAIFISCIRIGDSGDNLHYYTGYVLLRRGKGFFNSYFRKVNKYQFEPLFYFVLYLFHILKLPYQSFIFFEAIVVNILLYIASKKITTKYINGKEGGYPILTFFMMYCFGMYNVIIVRQTIAVMLCLLTLPTLQKKQYRIFAVTCLLLIGIHKSTLIWVMAPIIMHLPLDTKKQRAKFYLLYVVTFISAILFLQYGIQYLPGNTGKRLRWYVEHLFTDTGAYKSVFFAVYKSLANLAVLVVAFTYALKWFKNVPTYFNLYKLYMFGTLFLFISCFYGSVFARLATPFNMVSTFLLQQIVVRFKGKKRITLFILLSIYVFLRLFMYVHNDRLLTIGYETLLGMW